MHLQLERRPSPVGTLLLVTDDDGNLRGLDFAGHEPRMHRLLRRHYGSYALDDGKTPAIITRALNDYFKGNPAALTDIPVATGGTAFQRAVWKTLRTIPHGATRSYQQLAASIGKPAACRAVGAANGANPIAIVVPCHRVIGADGSMTGFASGIARKRWLLQHEKQLVTKTAPADSVRPPRPRRRATASIRNGAAPRATA